MSLYTGKPNVANGSRIKHKTLGFGVVVSQADTSFVGDAVYVRFAGMSQCQFPYLCFVKDLVSENY
jgi:hypothetical protein